MQRRRTQEQRLVPTSSAPSSACKTPPGKARKMSMCASCQHTTRTNHDMLCPCCLLSTVVCMRDIVKTDTTFLSVSNRSERHLQRRRSKYGGQATQLLCPAPHVGRYALVRVVNAGRQPCKGAAGAVQPVQPCGHRRSRAAKNKLTIVALTAVRAERPADNGNYSGMHVAQGHGMQNLAAADFLQPTLFYPHLQKPHGT